MRGEEVMENELFDNKKAIAKTRDLVTWNFVVENIILVLFTD